MKQDSDGADAPVSDKDEETKGFERIISGPGGFRVVQEATVDEMISSMGPADRIMVVAINDPELRKTQGTITVLKGETLADLDDLCKITEDPWHVAIRKAAYAQVCVQMWGKAPPEGTSLEHCFEISKRELREIMDSEMEHRSKHSESVS